MKAENFVFKGKFFVYSKELDKLKDAVIDFLRSEGYDYVSPISFFHNFLSTTFLKSMPKISTPFYLRAKKFLGTKTEHEIRTEVHFKSLRQLRDDVPFEINVSIYLGKLKNLEGTIVEILSKSAIYFKITQLRTPKFVSNEEYSFITLENKTFIEKIAKALSGHLIGDPKPLNEFVTTEVIEKLKFFGFENVAEMVRKGREKVELGDSGGLDDLRGAVENFLRYLILRLDKEPYPLHNPEKNIRLLKELRYIDEKIENLVRSILFNGVYLYLSDVKTHKRKDVDLFTSRLCFDITENVFDNLIERIVRYKTKASAVEDKIENKDKQNHPAEVAKS